MNLNKKYYKNIKRLFPVHTKKEKQYLKQLRIEIEEYDKASYDELVHLFGEPIEIVKSYYDTINSQYLLNKMNTKKIITILSLSIFILCSLYFGYKSYKFNELINNWESNLPTEINETVEVME